MAIKVLVKKRNTENKKSTKRKKKINNPKKTSIHKAKAKGKSSSSATAWFLDLVDPYLDKAYHIYFENFYTSLKLLKDLESRGTFACGTVRVDRGDFPKAFKKAKLATGQTHFMNNDSVVAVHWCDKRDVFAMSTMHEQC